VSNVLQICLFIIALPLCFACEDKKDISGFRFYSGPVVKAKNIVSNYSDSGKKVLILTAPLQLEFSNGDREFPKGMHVEFFNDKEELESTLTADYVHYNKMQELYTATGNVIIQSLAEQKTMTTELLHWSRVERRIFTNRFVKIVTPKETLTGTGLTAREDFSSYQILKPSGILEMQ
jgi:LPS export ABC transporter protein LptC